MKRLLSPRRRVVLAGVAAVGLLGGCAGSPGAALVVDGTTYSLDRVDELASVYCSVQRSASELQGQPFVSQAGKDSRRFVVGLLLQRELARGLAEQEGISADPSDYAVPPEQLSPFLDVFDDNEDELLLELVDIQSEADGITQAIGAARLGQSLGTAEPTRARQAGFEAIQTYGESVDIEVDPRLGLDDTAAVVTESGSLSVPVSDLAATSDPGDMPDALVCQ